MELGHGLGEWRLGFRFQNLIDFPFRHRLQTAIVVSDSGVENYDGIICRLTSITMTRLALDCSAEL